MLEFLDEGLQVSTSWRVMVFKDGEGDELVLVLELLLVDDFVKQSCDMFRRIVEGTATECTEHDAVVILHNQSWWNLLQG